MLEWQYLLSLTHDEENYVRWSAADVLGNAFSQLPDEEKDQVWQHLLNLTYGESSDLRGRAAYVLGNAFSQLSDKEKDKAWQYLLNLTHDENSYVRGRAADALSNAFSQLPDKDKDRAWKDLHRRAHDENIDVRWSAAYVLGNAFSQLPDKDKDKAWQYLLSLTHDENSYVRGRAAYTLGKAFSQLPDKYKEQAWQYLLSLTHDENSYVRGRAAYTLGKAFSQLPDKYKEQAWQYLHRLILDEDDDVRWNAVDALDTAFSQLPDKEKGWAWQYLISLANDENNFVTSGAIDALDTAFSQLPDKYKEQAWKDIIWLIQDGNIGASWGAASFLGNAFSQLSDKEKGWAWKDLHMLLIHRVDDHVASWATDALGEAFSQLSDKEKDPAWQDLHRLIYDEDHSVRGSAANALGKAFSRVPDKYKKQTWQDLIKLTQDHRGNVRMYSYHSLGRVFIYNATTSTDDKVFRVNLKEAIDYFEKSAQEATYYNPAKFCIPFYRSFLAVTSQELGSQEQVDRYLTDAKDAIAGSKSRKLLFEAVENLSKALREAQKASELHEAQAVLEACRPYCDHAAELLTKTEDMAPGASKVLRRGLPLIDKQIKAILKEIEGNSTRLLEVTKQTPFEPITARTDERLKGLSKIGYVDAESVMDDVVPDIRVMCSFLPPESRKSVCELENWERLDFKNKATLFKRAISKCATEMENISRQTKDDKSQIAYLRGQVMVKLDNIDIHVFKISGQSTDVIQSLRALEYELQKIKKVMEDLDRLGQRWENLGIPQQQALLELQKNAPEIVKELEKIAREKDDPDGHGVPKVPGSLWQKIRNQAHILRNSSETATGIAILSFVADLLQVISFFIK